MTRAPRVLFICTQMEAGGVQIRSMAMREALLAEGVPTESVFLYKKRAAFSEGGTVHCLSDRPPGSIGDYARIFVRLWRHIAKTRPTAIVGFAHYSSPIACLFGLLAGVPHRVATQTSLLSSVPKLARLMDLLCGMSGVYTKNVAASFATEAEFASYPASYRRRLVVVHNGITSKISTMTSDDARRTYSLPLDRPLILMCGRLSADKNHAFLLDVLPSVKGAHLAILGDGELRGALLDRARANGVSDRVAFLGEVAPERVRDFLRCGDVFAFPSRREAFGLAVAEAMMSGLPVVAADIPSLREVVGDAGILLATEAGEQQWAAVLRDLLPDRECRDEMSVHGVRQASRFRFETMLAGFKDACGLTPTAAGVAGSNGA